jgi:hypothetical protein
VTEQEATHLESLRRFLKRLVEDDKDKPPPRGANKRRHDRHFYMVEAHVRYLKRFDQLGLCPEQFVAYTKDISRSGVSFVHEYEMYVGEVVQVEVEVSGVHKSLTVKIVRCRRAGLKVFDIAGEFVKMDEVAPQ